jgi:hypothetical protein
MAWCLVKHRDNFTLPLAQNLLEMGVREPVLMPPQEQDQTHKPVK